MGELFNNLTIALTPSSEDMAMIKATEDFFMEAFATPSIEDFNITIISTTEARIYYTLGDEEVESIVDINANYSPREPMTWEYPGSPPEACIEEVFGLSVSERHEWDKWMGENDIEPDLLYAFEGKDDDRF